MIKASKAILLLGLIALIALTVGCSEVSAPTAPSSTESIYGSNIHVPLEDVLPYVESAGYRVVTSAQSALDDCDSVEVQRNAHENVAGSVNLQQVVRLQWSTNTIPLNMTISVVSPSACTWAVDLYPSPTQFDDYMTIIWNVDVLDLPDDFDYDDFVPLYVHDDGTVEELPFEWQGGHNKLVVQTLHFSRYILTTRSGSGGF